MVVQIAIFHFSDLCYTRYLHVKLVMLLFYEYLSCGGFPMITLHTKFLCIILHNTRSSLFSFKDYIGDVVGWAQSPRLGPGFGELQVQAFSLSEC